MSKLNKISIAIIILAFALATIFYQYLPTTIPTHWNAQGEVNGYMSKFWGLFLVPLIMLGLFLLLTYLPQIDPLKKNYKKFRFYYNMVIFTLVVYLFYIYLLTLIWNFKQFNFVQAILPAFAILFYIIGIALEKTKKNWFMGIRTPWTLNSNIVWTKTHKLSGKLFKISALISLIGIFFPNYAIFFIIVPIILASIISIVYSYLIYKKQK